MGGLQSCSNKSSVWWHQTRNSFATPQLSGKRMRNISCGKSKLAQGAPSSSPFIGMWTSIGIGRSEAFGIIAANVLAKFLHCCNLAILSGPTTLGPSWVLLMSSWPALAMAWTCAPDSSPLAYITMRRAYKELSVLLSSWAAFFAKPIAVSILLSKSKATAIDWQKISLRYKMIAAYFISALAWGKTEISRSNSKNWISSLKKLKFQNYPQNSRSKLMTCKSTSSISMVLRWKSAQIKAAKYEKHVEVQFAQAQRRRHKNSLGCIRLEC